MATIKNQFTATQTFTPISLRPSLASSPPPTPPLSSLSSSSSSSSLSSSPLSHTTNCLLTFRGSFLRFFFVSKALDASQKYISNLPQLPVFCLQNNTLTRQISPRIIYSMPQLLHFTYFSGY